MADKKKVQNSSLQRRKFNGFSFFFFFNQKFCYAKTNSKIFQIKAKLYAVKQI